MRLYITGDIHGSIKRFLPENWEKKGFPPMAEDDYVLVLGDFGIPWESMPLWGDEVHEGKDDADKLDFLAELPSTFLFIDGNHENFEMLYKYPEEEWNGGRIHRLRPNILHLMRGEVFNLKGMKFFCFGGGRSIDKAFRMENITWWKEEIPSTEEFLRAKMNLARVGNTVDLVFTHAAPLQFLVPHKDLLGFDPHRSKDASVRMLSEFESSICYQRWYFEHYHLDYYDRERSARWMYRDIDWAEW